MEVNIEYNGIEPTKEDKKLINDFISQLKKNYPLEDDIDISFQTKRTGTMTTGSRTDKNKLKILVKGRLNRDVLRTLAHEWSHEHQRTILKRKKGKDIGGKNEDEASAQASQEMKKFEKNNKSKEKSIYKPFSKKINEIESLLEVEFNSKETLISEIKKILNTISNKKIKKCIEKKYFSDENKTYTSIAQEMNVTVQTVINWHNKFIKLVKQKLNSQNT